MYTRNELFMKHLSNCKLNDEDTKLIIGIRMGYLKIKSFPISLIYRLCHFELN